MRLFRAGETCLYQHVWRKAVLYAIPTTVVEDDGEVIVSHLIPGTVTKLQPPKQGLSVYGDEDDRAERQRARIFATLNEPSSELVDHVWTAHRRLFIAKAGARHIVSLFWRASDERFLGWYVDFVQPVRRTPVGIMTMDLMLDLEIEPDLSEWSWKDEEDFAAAVDEGLYGPAVERDVRSEAQRVIDTIERRGWPFNTKWPRWKPDGEQAPATLPPAWSTVRVIGQAISRRLSRGGSCCSWVPIVRSKIAR